MVSIIVPIYKVEKYLDKCLQSISEQTYQQLEVILVNDGSPDQCEAICKKFCKRDKRFMLINKNNEGLGYARNTGLQYVTGEYVVFIDSDDYIMPDMIKSLVEAAKLKNADTVIGSYLQVTNNGKVIKNYNQANEEYVEENVLNKLLPKMLGSSPEGGDSIRMSVWNVLYTVRIIKENGILFCSEREYTSEDLFFDLDYYKYAKNVVTLENPQYLYRVNYTSLSYKYRPDRYEMKRKIYQEGKRRLKALNVGEDAYLRFEKYYFLGIKMRLRQETPALSGKNTLECVYKIGTICRDDILKQILLDYPVHRLGIKQRLFLLLIKYKFKWSIYFLSKFNMFN